MSARRVTFHRIEPGRYAVRLDGDEGWGGIVRQEPRTVVFRDYRGKATERRFEAWQYVTGSGAMVGFGRPTLAEAKEEARRWILGDG